MNRANWIRANIGPKGSGKTYDAIHNVISHLDRVIIFDPADDEYPGTKVIGNPKQAGELSKAKKFKIHYVPTILNHKQGRAIDAPGLEYACSIAWSAGNCTLAIDEAHLVCSPFTVPQQFMKLIRLGRHRCVSIFWISHSFSGVARMLTENTDELVLFRITEPLQLEAIAKRCGKDVALQVSRLRANSQFVTPQRLHYFTRNGEWVIHE